MDSLMFNVESREELLAIDRAASDMQRRARVALRVNPDIDPKTHAYISTGLKENKFGIPIDQALEFYQTARSLPNVDIVGVHQHIGSQITEVQPFVDAVDKTVNLIAELKSAGIKISYINIGGGLGITYKDETPPLPKDLSRALKTRIPPDCTLILEPGRAIVGNAGILVTRALYHKESDAKKFLIVDAGMNDLIRPSLYDAYHEIKPVKETAPGAETIVADVVGPICESGDFLAKERTLPGVAQGDLLAVMGAGAYGFSMSSNYNSRPRIPEVLAKGNEFFTIRERETYNDLIKGEKLPRWLEG
jgi:diaminopimelate decarboxylase